MSKIKIYILVSFSVILLGSIGLICYLQRSRYIMNRVAQTEQLIMEQQITTTMMPEARIQMCRFGCLKKFATEDFACLEEPECALCWDQCYNKIMEQQNGEYPMSWHVRILSLIRQASIVTADLQWTQFDYPTQCLVTWEVSGGGLMGNLLTDSTTVQLSLWPHTVYEIEVTCKNKDSGELTRSEPLRIDTTNDINSPIHNSNLEQILEIENELHQSSQSSSSSSSTSSTPPPSSFNLIYDIRDSRTEIILGTITAILVFAVILVFFIFTLKRRTPSDKQSLIENEIRDDLNIQTVHV